MALIWWTNSKNWIRKHRLRLAVTVVLAVAAIAVIYSNRPVGTVYTQMRPSNIVTGPPGNELNKPTAVAVGLRGELIIADTGNKRVVVMEEDGRYSLNFGGPGSGRAELGQPVSLDVAPNGSVYVADREKQAIFVFSSEGQYLYKIFDRQPGKFIPLGIKVGKDGNILVFNAAEKKFRLYDAKRRLIRTLPWDTDSDITAFDMDPEESRLYGINPDNEVYYEMIGTTVKVQGKQKVLSPQGVVYNRSRQIVIVSDSLKNKLVVFGKNGSYLGEFGGTGNGMGEFNYPAGLALDESGKLYVADRDNNRIVIYNY